MSELQRSFAKAKLTTLPFEPPLPHFASHGINLDGEVNAKERQEDDEEEEEEEEENDSLKPLPDRRSTDDDSSSASSASSASSTGTIKPSPSKHLFARPKGLVAFLCSYLLLYEGIRGASPFVRSEKRFEFICSYETRDVPFLTVCHRI